MLIRRRALEVRIHNEKDARTISAAGLNTSPKLRAYIRSLSNSSFTSVLRCLVSGAASSLDAFSSYPSGRGYPALPCQTTGKLVAPSPRSSRTKGPFRSRINTPQPQSNKPVSRRSKPISRSPLMGEQPHPSQLLHREVGKRRHRSSKPPGRYVLLLVTTQLSPR